MPEHNSATPYQCLSVPAPYFAVKTLPLPCESQLFLSMSPLSFAIVSHHNPITMIFCSKTLLVKTMTKRRLNTANLCYAIPWHIFSTPTPNKAFPLQIVSMQSVSSANRFIALSKQFSSFAPRSKSIATCYISIASQSFAFPKLFKTFPAPGDPFPTLRFSLPSDFLTSLRLAVTLHCFTSPHHNYSLQFQHGS